MMMAAATECDGVSVEYHSEETRKQKRLCEMLDIPICPIYPFVPTSHPIYFVTMVITNSYCVIHQRH